MATLVRIKRRRHEEPSENIAITPKRSKTEEPSTATPAIGNVTILRRVGTLNTEDEPIESHLNLALKQENEAWARRASYKKTSTPASVAKLKENQKKETKSYSKSGRIKLVNARRDGLDKVANLFDGVIEEDTKQSKDEDVITCNSVPMKSEKVDYVYDLYFTSVPVEHSSWMENICEFYFEEDPVNTQVSQTGHVNVKDKQVSFQSRFQRYSCNLVHEDEIETHQDDYDYDDEDDENDECNWRNDYPEEDDDEDGNESDYLDADEYMVSKMQNTRLYDSDESYDVDDYEEAFDDDGSLVNAGGSYMSTFVMYQKKQRKTSSSSDSSDSSGSSDSEKETDSDDSSIDDE